MVFLQVKFSYGLHISSLCLEDRIADGERETPVFRHASPRRSQDPRGQQETWHGSSDRFPLCQSGRSPGRMVRGAMRTVRGLPARAIQDVVRAMHDRGFAVSAQLLRYSHLWKSVPLGTQEKRVLRVHEKTTAQTRSQCSLLRLRRIWRGQWPPPLPRDPLQLRIQGSPPGQSVRWSLLLSKPASV